MALAIILRVGAVSRTGCGTNPYKPLTAECMLVGTLYEMAAAEGWREAWVREGSADGA